MGVHTLKYSLILLLFFVVPTYGVNYFVSPSGSDDHDGLSEVTAWLSINNGDQDGILTPGDTINVLPGVHNIPAEMQLKLSGSADQKITYRRYGKEPAILDAGNLFNNLLVIEASHIVLSGLEFTNPKDDAITIKGDSCRVVDCYIHACNRDGIRVEGINILLLKNIVANISDHGMNIRDGADNCYIYNNTFYNCGKNGIETPSKFVRIFNNIILNIEKGINGKTENICGFNDIWNNSSDAYGGGAKDSAGGMFADPRFIDAAGGNFVLQRSSPAIDAGLDLGYAYSQSAPEMGAIEKYSVYYIDPAGDDRQDGLGPATAWASIDNGNMQLVAGDSVKILPGLYTDSIEITTGGIDGDEIVFAGDSSTTVIDGSGVVRAVQINADYVNWSGIRVTNASWTNVSISGSHVTVGSCQIDSAGQYGINVVSGESTRIHRNVFLENQASEIILHADSARIINNTFCNPGTNVINALSSSHNEIINCIMYGKASSNFAIRADATTSLTYSNIYNFNTPVQGGVIFGEGCIKSDPLLINPELCNLHLSSLSPAIDAGKDIGLPFYGPAPDMGAYETSVLASLSVIPTYDSLFADSAYQYDVIALGDDGYPAAFGILSWDHTFATGDIDASGLYTPQLVGSGTIEATSDIGSIFGHSELMTVVPGSLDSLYITPNRDTISADSTRQFTALGYDIYGNVLSDPGELRWDVQLDIGLIDSSGLFDAVTAESGFIRVSADGGFQTITDTIFVVPGEVVSIEVEPVKNVVEQGQTYQYEAIGYDTDSNLVAKLTDSVVWSTDDATGSVSSSGLYTAGNIISPPDYTVTAVYGGSVSGFGAVTVTGSGVLAYVLVEYEDGTEFGDTTLTTDIDNTKLFCRGYDFGDLLLGDVSVEWYLVGIDSIGTVEEGPDAQTTLTLTRLGTGRVVAVHGSGNKDTTGVITSTAGLPSELIISPKSITVNADSSVQFAAVSVDADGNASDPGVVPTWEVIGDIGSIDGTGLFNPIQVGSGSIVATGAGLADTAGPINVFAGILHTLVVAPDSAIVGLGDSLVFSAEGFDGDNNPADMGELIWLVLGKIGDIDTDGVFTSSLPGVCSLMVTSSIGGVNDISGAISVEALIISEALQGNGHAYPGQDRVPLLAFQVENVCPSDKSITSVSVQDASQGPGNLAQRLTNTDSLGLYLDIDYDKILTPADSLISSALTDEEVTAISFAPINVPSGAAITFIVGGDISRFPHDGDWLDYLIIPATDFTTADETPISAPDTINSFGFGVIDGMIADQLTLIPAGLTEISPDKLLNNVLTLDIPRNGYATDTLSIFSLINKGTAAANDLDSIILFQDDGNGFWDGSISENRLGNLVFTGNRWMISGITAPLINQQNRFFVAAQLSEYPTNGATISLTIPQDGLDMTSANDGPFDSALSAVDIIVINAAEEIFASTQPILAQSLIPGEISAPLTVVELTNGRAAAIVLDSLRVTLNNVDPLGATQEQLDSQFDSLLIYLKGDDNFSAIGSSDIYLGTALVEGGEALFDVGGLSIPGGGNIAALAIVAGTNLHNAKNGNTVNIGVADAADVYLEGAVVTGDFPLINGENHDIDAFPAATMTINSIEGSTLFGGQTQQPVLDFELPRDGYSSGILTDIRINNTGTLNEFAALDNIQLWVDLTDDGLTADDNLQGSFSYNSGDWELLGLSWPLSNPSTRFIVAVEVSESQFVGGTLNFQIPVEGVHMWTGTSGPDDIAVTNPDAHMIFPGNRITAISIPAASQTVAPGSSGNLIFTYALYNGYNSQSQFLQTIILSNISRTTAGLSYADHELGQIRLYLDADNNRMFDDDSMIAAGQFSDSTLQMTGLDIELKSENLYYFFVLADLPLDVIDSDSLAVSISSPSALVFEQQVNINGDLPLSSSGYSIVDGSVQGQYSVIDLSPRTLSPNDTSIVLFAFRPAINGNQLDYLNSLTVSNTEDADSGDITLLELWIDLNGDDRWQNTDSLAGLFTYTGSAWHLNGLNLEVNSSPPALFVVGDISATVSANARFRAEIPVNGCVYASDNDGPRDISLVATNTFTMSHSSLRVDYSPLPETFSIGQAIDVQLTVTNLSDIDVLDNVYVLIDSDNPGIVNLIDSVADPQTLGPGVSAGFTYSYSADMIGTVSWNLQAVAPTISDSSAIVQTNPVKLQTSPADVMVQLINSIPASVIRGQDNIYPLSINITHPDLSSDAAALRLDSIALTVTDCFGTGLLADDVFSRLIVTAGPEIVALYDNLPAASTIPVIFSEPVIILPEETAVLSLLINIDSSTTADDFVLSVLNADAVPLTDENTLLPVSIDPAVVFPLQTAPCQIDIPSREMVISSSSIHDGTANYGQDDVGILRLYLRHPGDLGSSSIKLSGFSLKVINDSDQIITASEILDEVSVVRQSTAIGGLGLDQLDASDLVIQLNTPVILSPGGIDSLDLQVSIVEESIHTAFAQNIADSANFDVRDLSSGSQLNVATDTLLSSGPAFPMASALVQLTNPALPPELCIASVMSSSVVGGTDAFELMELAIAYPDGINLSPVHMQDIRVSILDTLGYPLDPDRLFDQIGASINGGPVVYQPYVILQDGATVFEFNESGLILSANDSLNIRLIGDIETDTPFDHFVIHVSNDQAILLYDVSDTSHQPGFIPVCGLTFPYTSEITKVFLPAGRPDLAFEILPVQLSYPGQTGLSVYDGEWVYDATAPLGDLAVQAVHGQVLKRTQTGLSAFNGGIIFEAVHLWLDDQLVAADTILDSDSLNMQFDEEFLCPLGTGLTMRISCDIKTDAPFGNYVLRFEDSTFMDIVDKNLTTPVYPKILGDAYPIYSAEISLSSANLDSSFTNYPNPFQPSDGERTTIGFSISEDAYVDIEIFSITGEAVKNVAINSFRTAGRHQSDVWTGLNDAGLDVLPGTYYCRITTRYISGREESLRRKIAIIR